LSLRTAWRRYGDLVAAGWVEKLRRFSVTFDEVLGKVRRRQETNAVRLKLPVEVKEWPTEAEASDFVPQWPPPASDGLGAQEERPEPPTDELVDPYLCQDDRAESDSPLCTNSSLLLPTPVDNGDHVDVSRKSIEEDWRRMDAARQDEEDAVKFYRNYGFLEDDTGPPPPTKKRKRKDEDDEDD
jgi:hypothetical protein